MGDHTGGAGRISAGRATGASDYRQFASKAEAMTFMQAEYDAKTFALPQAEQDVLMFWTSESSNLHVVVNQWLRQGGDELSPFYQGRLATIDQAFKRKAAVLQHDLTVQRSFSFHYETIKQLKAGDTFTDYGFVSTSVSPTGAGWNTPDVTVRVPRGTCGIWVSPLAIMPDEGELLLKRGTTFRVVQASTRGEPPTLEVIGQT